MATTYTAQLQLPSPGIGDSGWGVTENTARTLVDSAVAGIQTVSVTGVNVTLTSNQGAVDQARNVHFVVSGVMTTGLSVLWPAGLTRAFSVLNNTSGAFTLSAGVTTGSGLPAGTQAAVPQGFAMELVSDGTNVTQRVTAITSGSFSNATLASPTITGSPVGASFVPTGAILPYAVTTAPTGWLNCDGTAVPRTGATGFPTLFAVIGTTFGTGNGATTFNVPDMRGRTAAGFDSGNSTGRLTGVPSQGVSASGMANVGGEQSHLLTIAELASHDHAPGGGSAFLVNAGGSLPVFGGAGIVAVDQTTLTAAAGGNTAHNNVQPTMILNYIIKT